MKPIVGISPLYDEEKRGLWMRPGYLDVLYACGAIPLVLPFDSDKVDIEQILSICDGLLLTGGPDIDPALYGQERYEACDKPQHVRDELEYRLIEKALDEDIPLLGICRGSQILNVYLGGTLYRDIATDLEAPMNHRMVPPYETPCHKVILDEGEPLQALLKTSTLPVNSIHHQAIHKIAPELVQLAHAHDGICEGIWMPGKRFVWGVQWHPEWIWDVDPRQQQIVQHFVDACAG